MNEIIKIDFIEKFNTLVNGLYVMSETDAPLTPFIWKKPMPLEDANIRTKLKLAADAPIERLSIDDFFANAVTPRDWHSDEEKSTVLKFQNLVAIVKEDLQNIQVLKINTIKRDVYILGIQQNGSIGGLKTLVVET